MRAFLAVGNWFGTPSVLSRTARARRAVLRSAKDFLNLLVFRSVVEVLICGGMAAAAAHPLYPKTLIHMCILAPLRHAGRIYAS